MPLGKNLKKDTLIPSEKKGEETVAKPTVKSAAKPKAKAKKAASKSKVNEKIKAKTTPKAVKTPVKKTESAKEKVSAKKVSSVKKDVKKPVKQPEVPQTETKKELQSVAPTVVDEKQESPVDIVPGVVSIEREQRLAKPPQAQGIDLLRQKIGTVKYLTEEEYQAKKRLKAKFDQEIKSYAGKSVQLIVFKMGGEKYAIEIDRIKEVVHTPKVSKIPHAPNFIKGISNVRGTVMVVLDLGLKFGIETSEELKEFILVIQNKDFKAGILVDEVPLSVKVSGDDIVSSSGLLRNTSLDETYIKGIINTSEDMIIFIDIAELVQEDEVSIISQSLVGQA
ncbi:chemotaxis protein CheW [Reichenbachiella sp. MSK19-1]|uniref:chemotaxis protein CheW n=1 Tax=Reichenbachiella sp. MSK19-1 TaxID=1897631 RepID=UPI000E6CBBDB|nr:chemotaxis protein CheW [Reichenbachiella sp. MSK19-1]RJE74458.1 hypothetical protein BGP76_14975 [Reichenbachiella sp. MSK19-1]